MIPTLRKLSRLMNKADFNKLTQAQRREILELYRSLAEPMDNLWRAMMLDFSDLRSKRVKPNDLPKKKKS